MEIFQPSSIEIFGRACKEVKAKVEGNRKDKQENRQEYIELLDGVAKIASITRAISQVNGRFDDSNYEALATTHSNREETTNKSERLDKLVRFNSARLLPVTGRKGNT